MKEAIVEAIVLFVGNSVSLVFFVLLVVALFFIARSTFSFLKAAGCLGSYIILSVFGAELFIISMVLLVVYTGFVQFARVGAEQLTAWLLSALL
jgi:hypothetical protein